MTSFISTFKQTVFGVETRKRYSIVVVAIVTTVLTTSVCCQLWIDNKIESSRQAYRELGPSTELIVVGSSHFLGQNRSTLSVDVANLSHGGNNLRMINLILKNALNRAPNTRHVVIELGHVVLTIDSLRLRGHSFIELGVSPWDLPGTFLEKITWNAERFPPFRIPRLTPQNLVMTMRPELKANAQGVPVTRIGTYVNNGDFRAAGIHASMSNEGDTISDNFAALKETLAMLTHRDIEVFVVLTPHTIDYRKEMTPDEMEMLDRAKAICEEFGGVTLLDFYDSDEHGFELQEFADCDHLNTLGNQRFGRLLRAKIFPPNTTDGNVSPELLRPDQAARKNNDR